MRAQAVVQTVTTGSPRVLDPLSVAWYDNLMGVTSTTRYVNNMDIVPSFPLGQSLLCGPCNMHAACARHVFQYIVEILYIPPRLPALPPLPILSLRSNS